MTDVVGRYRFIEDMALSDCAVEIDGDDLSDLFSTAAAAVAALMVDPATVTPTVEREVALEAETYDLLLYDWLAELIFRKDRDGEVYPAAEVAVAADRPALAARLRGAAIDDARMALRNDPKAVTLHAFALDRIDSGWRARVVIDL
jgi:SHS2 domain-containing protein